MSEQHKHTRDRTTLLPEKEHSQGRQVGQGGHEAQMPDLIQGDDADERQHL
jgi:hypothetical protein